jgi:hypothetical protein
MTSKPVTWTLKPIKTEKWNGFDRKNLHKNPFIPLVISAIVSGVTRNFWWVGTAIICTALWLYFYLSPLVNQCSVRWVNRTPKYRAKITSKNQPERDKHRLKLENERAQKLESVRRKFKLLLVALLVLPSLLCIHWAVNREHKYERDETYQNLVTDAAMPSEESLNVGEITIRNNSPNDILLRSFSCFVRSMSTTKKVVLGGSTFGQDYSDLKIKRGGDGQSMPCTPNQVITVDSSIGRTYCADVEWTVKYVLVDQENLQLEKRFRYVLKEGHQKWEQIAIGTPQLRCGTKNETQIP